MENIENLRFTSDPKLIKKLTRDFTEIKVKSKTWGKSYLCPKTKENWQIIYPETELHGGGKELLIKLPEPRKIELINIIINSTNIDDIASASALLKLNEKEYNDEFREDLIIALENRINQKEFSWTKIEAKILMVIIDETYLINQTNRFPILGKNDIEITRDFNYFKDISQRAKKIYFKAESKL